MSKITWLIRFSCAVLVLGGCTSVSPGEKSTGATVCKERNLHLASQPISTTFQNGKLQEISLGDKLITNRLEVSADGSKLAVPIFRGSAWTSDGLYLFDTNNGQLSCVLPMDNNGSIFEGIAFSPNNMISASLFLDGTVLIRDANSGEIIRQLESTKYDSPGWIDFNKDGSRLVTSGYSQPTRVWDIDAGQLITSFDSARVALSPNGNLIAIPDSEGIKVVDIDSQQTKTSITDPEAKVHFLFSPNGEYLYVLNSFSEVTVWNAQSGEMINKLNPSIDYEEFAWTEPMRLSLSADGTRLLMQNPTKVIVWDTKSWQELANSADIEKSTPIVDAVIMPNGQSYLVNYSYNTIRFWRLNP
jgi:WD40 repeat protein